MLFFLCIFLTYGNSINCICYHSVSFHFCLRYQSSNVASRKRTKNLFLKLSRRPRWILRMKWRSETHFLWLYFHWISFKIELMKMELQSYGWRHSLHVHVYKPLALFILLLFPNLKNQYSMNRIKLILIS